MTQDLYTLNLTEREVELIGYSLTRTQRALEERAYAYGAEGRLTLSADYRDKARAVDAIRDKVDNIRCALDEATVSLHRIL